MMTPGLRAGGLALACQLRSDGRHLALPTLKGVKVYGVEYHGDGNWLEYKKNELGKGFCPSAS